MPTDMPSSRRVNAAFPCSVGSSYLTRTSRSLPATSKSILKPINPPHSILVLLNVHFNCLNSNSTAVFDILNTYAPAVGQSAIYFASSPTLIQRNADIRSNFPFQKRIYFGLNQSEIETVFVCAGIPNKLHSDKPLPWRIC